MAHRRVDRQKESYILNNKIIFKKKRKPHLPIFAGSSKYGTWTVLTGGLSLQWPACSYGLSTKPHKPMCLDTWNPPDNDVLGCSRIFEVGDMVLGTNF